MKNGTFFEIPTYLKWVISFSILDFYYDGFKEKIEFSMTYCTNRTLDYDTFAINFEIKQVVVPAPNGLRTDVTI